MPPPTDEEVGGVLARIAARVQRLLRRRGRDPWEADGVQADPLVDESPALVGLSSASVQGRIALGPRAGARVWRLGDGPDAPWVLSTVPRHAHLAGFDLHANVALPAADRARPQMSEGWLNKYSRLPRNAAEETLELAGCLYLAWAMVARDREESRVSPAKGARSG